MANSAIPGIVFTGGGGDVSLTPNQFKTLKFNAAPAVMEFGISIGDGTDPVVLNGGMNAAAIKAAIESSDDFTGFTVDVYGSTTTSTGDDGVALHSGKFILAVQGTAPFPAWGAVQNSEVQSFVVEDGEPPGEVFYRVVGAGTIEADGDYYENGTLNGYPKYDNETDPDYQIVWNAGGGWWILRKASASRTYYEGGFDTSNPANGTWGIGSWGESPAPTVTSEVDGGAYSLNGGSTFTLEVNEAELQTNQRDLGGEYTTVVVKGGGEGTNATFNSYFPFSISDAPAPAATGVGAITGVVYTSGDESQIVVVDDATIGEILPALTAYIPADANNWEAPVPVTIAEAQRRIEVAVAGLLGTQIP